jgi:hypothetical protein
MRRPWMTLVAVVVIGCSTTGGGAGPPTAGSSAVHPAAPSLPSRTAEAPVSVTGDPATGASRSFTLSNNSGLYDLAWTTTADTAGCYFRLDLVPATGGPSVQSDGLLLPEAKSYSRTDTWLGVFGGTYVLQEDRSGYRPCTGSWSATITPRQLTDWLPSASPSP